MKKMIKFFAISMLFFGMASSLVAQSTASATATARIITPISITNDVDMDFGNIAVSGAGGTVTLPPVGARTFTGSITFPAITGTVTAASFIVNGEGTSTYAITLPTTDYTITRVGFSETMIVNAFTSNPSGTGALTGGTQTLNVGATLNISAGQTPGTYTNATGFDVTVNYN